MFGRLCFLAQSAVYFVDILKSSVGNMDKFFEQLASINNVINDFVWVKIGLVLLIGTGILMTCCTKFFRITHIKHRWIETIGSVFKKNSDATKKTDKKSISQLQALCTALAATIGTGNIAGVAAAIVIGGPGAVFCKGVFFSISSNRRWQGFLSPCRFFQSVSRGMSSPTNARLYSSAKRSQGVGIFWELS